MGYTELFEELVQYEGNNRIIFFNPNNNRWVRMKKSSYASINKNPEKKERLLQKFQQDYQLFESGSEECDIRSVYFAVTGKCNLQCDFCTMNSGPNVSMEDDLVLDEIRNILIPKLKEVSPRKIIITGGEPVVRKDIIEILKNFTDAFGKERILLQTNGLLLTEDFIRDIKPYVAAVEVSIENIFVNRTLLTRMKKIFRCIRDNQLELSLSFVLDDNSDSYLWEAIDLCHEYDSAFTLRIVTLVGRAADSETYKNKHFGEMEILKKYYKYFSYLLEKEYLDEKFISGYLDNLQPKKTCGAFGKILAVHPDGTTFMCGNFKHSDYSMGNIREKAMPDIVMNLKKKLMSEEIKRRFLVDQNPNCKSCPESFFCPGPCAAEMAESSPRNDEVDNKCLSKRAILYFNMFYYDKDKSVKDNFESMVGFLKNIIDGKMQFT